MASSRLGALFALYIIGIPAFAEEPVALPPVDVPIAPAPDSPESPVRRDLSGAATIVPVKERRAEVKDAADLLTTVPGTIVSDVGGVGQAKTLSMRGAAPNGVMVMLDGTPLGYGGGADLSQLPLAIIDRFEVLRGGGSRYGSGALGGVVNVVTRAPAETLSASGELTVGAFDTQSASVSASAKALGGNALVVLHGLRTKGDFSYAFDPLPNLKDNPLVTRLRENNQSQSGGALLRYRTRAGNWDTDAVAELFAQDRGLAGTAQNPTPDAHENSQRLSATVRASRTVADDWLLSARGYSLFERSTLQGGGFGAASTGLHALYGIEGVGEALLASRHSVSFTAGAAGESYEEHSWARLSAMAVDDVLFRDGEIVLSPSVRFDRVGPYNLFSPKLGGLVTLPHGFELRGNVGQAHRAPSFLELYVAQGTLIPNPSLRPERALFSDLQLAHKTERSSVAVGGYYSLYEDLISYELYPPMLAKPFNFRTARAYGAEVEGELRPHRLVSVSGAYTLGFSENLRDDVRYYLKQLPYRPRHKVSARVSGGPELFRGRVELLGQSEQFVNRTETIALPARAFVNVGVTSVLMHSPELALSAELKNVFDTQASDLDGYPLPGRAAYVSLTIGFEGRESGKGNP